MRSPSKLTEMTNLDFDSAIKKATLSVMRSRRILQPYESNGKEIGVGEDEEKEDINGCVYDNIHSEEKDSDKERDKERRTDNRIGVTVTPNSKQPNVQPVHLTPHTQHVRTSERTGERTQERTGEYLHERTYSTDEETSDPKIPVRRRSMGENQKKEDKNGKKEKDAEKECICSRSENSKIKGGKPAGSGLRTTSSSGSRGEKKEQSISPPKLRKSASNFDSSG